MRIKDLLARGRPVVSFEFYPPKGPSGEQALLATIEALRALEPGFVSVTRTGGADQVATIDLVTRIRAMGIEAMAHITCIDATRAEMAAALDLCRERGIENVLALRGDRPAGTARAAGEGDGFYHAVDLVRFIRARGYEFCLGGAGYPEGHVECRDRDRDVLYLRDKVEAGLDFVITQLFYDNADYFSFVARARSVGIRVPIIPGIMPITNFPQIDRITSLCGATIPASLRAELEAVRDDQAAAFAAGVDFGFRQCAELLRGGAPGIHFYTLNRSPATRAIHERLRAAGLLGV